MPRVALLGSFRSWAFLLDDGEPLVRVDHMLDGRIHVVRADKEVSGLGAHRLVLTPRCGYRFMTLGIIALAEEIERPLGVRDRETDVLDPLVDLTKQILVLVLRATHAARGSVLSTTFRASACFSTTG
jgi:hypothetical protein